ncbi:YdcF family protein [Leifsonia sp. NPDC077715]|uniref:YdcF family protein n=1 Tax=Leifsonia sp. NPDC077715 TaxID=3155539 RepID=UPI0034284575
MLARVVLLVSCVFVAVLAWSELVHNRASRRRLGLSAAAASVSEAVVVLGYRNRAARANFVNRYRVRAGLRSFDGNAGASVLVLCGGRVAGAVPEAELMARYARGCGFTGTIRLDTTSTTTWENIQNAVPLIEDVDSIKIVSNSLHAEKGRAYLWKLRPDLAARLRRGAEHRFGEIVLLKPAAAIIGLRGLARLRPE